MSDGSGIRTRQVLGEFAKCDPLVSEQLQLLAWAGNQAASQENLSLQPLSRTSGLISHLMGEFSKHIFSIENKFLCV